MNDIAKNVFVLSVNEDKAKPNIAMLIAKSPN